MRVLLCVDMEGISQITSYEQLWPEFPDYWESGKEATTADTLAAVNGLLDGGVTAITVCELHGPPTEAIIDLDRLPDEVDWVGADVFLRSPEMAAEHDALFLLGWHARCGTPDGFMSHTGGINMRVRIDNRPVTEAHINAWRTALPLIGVTGDAALGPQLDFGLETVPFLAVKQSRKRSASTPIYSAEESAAAILAFATWCVENAGDREQLPLPDRFVLGLSVPPHLADRLEGQNGLRRTSPAVLAKSATDWWYETEPALAGAMFESFRQLFAPNTEPSERKQILEAWALAQEPEWLT